MSAQRKQSEGFPGQRLVVVPPEVVKQVSKLPVTRDLTVTHLGHFVTAPGHFVRRARGAGQWVGIHCLEGTGKVIASGTEHTIHAGDFVFLEPGRPHEYAADPVNPWSIFWIHFTGIRAKDHMEALGWSGGPLLIHVPSGKTMLEAFEDLYRHTLHGMSDAEMLAMGTSLARLLGLARLCTRAREIRARKVEDRLLRVMSKLRESPQAEWTVSEMARMAGMSAGYFSEQFRQRTGSPPQTFLIRLRLQMACRILEQEQESIERTAVRVGYEDAYYFSRLFRKHLGVAPSRFRRDARAGG